ncbi:hypothetical protein [Dongia sp.]|uniref:hypothetical protein n=1 Tax=Dongia sp. TaxID=1977262 RepID=UPI0035AFA680
MDEFVDKALLTQIDRIAASSGKSRQEIVDFIIRAWLKSRDGQDTMAIVQGLEEVAAGNVHDMDDVIAELEAIVRGDDDG